MKRYCVRHPRTRLDIDTRHRGSKVLISYPKTDSFPYSEIFRPTEMISVYVSMPEAEV
jgi:hypothetical protein